jgi:hypothetical protein
MPNNATPDTVAYLVLGLIVATALMAGFIVSMVARQRNLQKDLELVEQLRDEK